MTIQLNVLFLFVVLLVGKFTLWPQMSWLWVLAPIWIPLGVLAIIGAFILFLVILKLMYLKL